MKENKSTYKPVQVLTVFYNKEDQKIKVGRLAYQRTQIWFEYDVDFLQSGIELSPIKLHLQKGVISSKERTFDGLFGLFNDSLPDGWGMLLLDRHLTSLSIDFKGLSPLDRLA